MSAKGDYLSGKQLAHVLNVAAFAAPATVYLALYTDAPTSAGGGVEVAGGAYARMPITGGPASWSSVSSTSYANAAAVVFPQATAGWGLVTHCAVLDAAVGGNLLYFAELPQPIDVASGETIQFSTGDIVITEE